MGEGGQNISGGQRARLALARACYSEASIFLLDDPLSAVDAKVANNIFNNCLKGYLSNKAVVLVTHQLAFLPLATRILALDSSGRPAFYGSYEQFTDSAIDDSLNLFCAADDINN